VHNPRLDPSPLRSVGQPCAVMQENKPEETECSAGAPLPKRKNKMSLEAIVVTIISSLLSGIIGVGVSACVFYKLERHKLKLDLARRLLGHRFLIQGDNFSCAMNEVIAVFADKPEVLLKMSKLYEALQAPGKPNCEGALVDFLKEVCKSSGLTQVTLNDMYLLKTFNARG
jgi:hypothetical protein